MQPPHQSVARAGDWRQRRGRAGEQIAALYLAARGLEVLERNLRCRRGELDLVCIDQGVLVIVEVRQRSGAAFGGALASVSACKQRRIILAARFFVTRRRAWRKLRVRFDVIALQGAPGGRCAIEWIKDAFFAAT